jgi:hypothetical protein
MIMLQYMKDIIPLPAAELLDCALEIIEDSRFTPAPGAAESSRAVFGGDD